MLFSTRWPRYVGRLTELTDPLAKKAGASRPRASNPALQPSDSDVAELHGAGAVLEGDGPSGCFVSSTSTTFMPLRMTVIFGPFAVMS